MKKFLLSVSAIAFALSVSAQAPVSVESAILSRTAVSLNITASTEALSHVKDFRAAAAKSKVARANDDNSIYGNYISDNLRTGSNLHECYNDVFEVANLEQDGATYNVLVKLGGLNIEGEAAQVYGVYDEGSKTITIPSQVCYTHPTYGNIDYIGLAESDKPDSYSITSEVVYTQKENGSWVPNVLAWGMMLNDEKAGDLKGNPWNLGFNNVLYPVNATINGNAVKKKDWTEFESMAYVDDQNEVVNVYNFENGFATIYVNEDGATVSMPTNQPIIGLPQSAIDEGFGESMNITGVKIDGESIRVDYDAKFVPGTISATDITFPDYFTICSKAVEDNLYLKGWYHGVTINKLKGIFQGATAGVKGINDNAVKANDNRIFNLAGQQVGENYKGIVIKNGQKFLKK